MDSSGDTSTRWADDWFEQGRRLQLRDHHAGSDPAQLSVRDARQIIWRSVNSRTFFTACTGDFSVISNNVALENWLAYDATVDSSGRIVQDITAVSSRINLLYYHTSVSWPFFQVHLDQPVPPRVLFLHILRKRTSGISGTDNSYTNVRYSFPAVYIRW